MKTALKLTVVTLILSAAFYLNKSGAFQQMLQWIDQLGFWAPWGFLLIYILTCIFFIPSFVFTFAAGALFGLGEGILLSLMGLGIGSLGAFLIGRYIARDTVIKHFGDKKEFRQMNEAVKLKGWKIVTLARLSPVFPFLVGNYAFGLTKIPALHYLFASIVGTLPSTAVYVYAGTAAGALVSSSLDGRQRTSAEWALLAAGFAATLVLTWYIRRVARQALQEGQSSQS